MGKFSTRLHCLSVLAAVAVTPAAAKPSQDDVAGALVILGVAALMQHEAHYKDGYSPSGPQGTASFEEGYRDALHGVAFVNSSGSVDYAYGYDAGSKERESHLAHRTRSARNEVPADAMRGCAARIAEISGTSAHNVHVVKTVKRGPNDFMVEGVLGHEHTTCVMGGGGKVVDVYAGRMQ